MQIHNAVGVKCETCAATENQGAGDKYKGKSMLNNCVCII